MNHNAIPMASDFFNSLLEDVLRFQISQVLNANFQRSFRQPSPILQDLPLAT
jgi:hypothetical protein